MKRILFLLLTLTLVLLPLRAQQRGTPRPGEGVAAFLLRHNRAPKLYTEDFLKLNRGKLGKNGALLQGVSYRIPPKRTARTKHTAPTSPTKSNPSSQPATPSPATPPDTTQTTTPTRDTKLSGVVNEPLFGTELAKVTVTSQRLKGACFYVVSGHGGPDPGAIGKVDKHELHEDEYAYDIALRLARVLMQEGAKVHIIIQDPKDGIRDVAYLPTGNKETCMGETIPRKQTQRLAQRCRQINALYAKERKKYTYHRSIFIHVDSRSKSKQTDVFFYHKPGSKQGELLAGRMKNKFESNYGKHQPGRGFRGTVSDRNLYVLNNSTPTALFVELGNIQNTFDQKRLLINHNRQALGKWLMEGFVVDFSKQ